MNEITLNLNFILFLIIGTCIGAILLGWEVGKLIEIITNKLSH